MVKLASYKTNEIKRSYYLNLFSSNAEKTVKVETYRNTANTADVNVNKNYMFKWNIRDLQLGSIAEIALVQLIHTGAKNNTGYTIRCLETYADGFDSYNQTSAILYMGLGLNEPSIPTYHKLISNNLNTITFVVTDNNTSSDTVNNGFSASAITDPITLDVITFSVILHVVDYVDDNQKI